jgi:hypothetical protein
LNTALTLLGIGMIVLVLFEGFETIILPRSVSRGFRMTRLFYISFWAFWRSVGRRITNDSTRESFFAFFGPLSLILILILWACMLVFGFALIQFANGFDLMSHAHGFFDILYFSGVTFTTLGFGDITPMSYYGKVWAVVESGTGFGFLAIVIGYLPVLYQSFSRREVSISLLDARAGSPPTAGELLYRYGKDGNLQMLSLLLREWEVWTSDVLETHLSYPVLAFYRSQHSRQSWVAALTAVLDASALIIVGVKDGPSFQAKLTFAMARHAVVDLGIIFHVEPMRDCPDRLPPETMRMLVAKLAEANIPFNSAEDSESRLKVIRATYEPFIAALANRFEMPLPPWIFEHPEPDNWKASGMEDGELR